MLRASFPVGWLIYNPSKVSKHRWCLAPSGVLAGPNCCSRRIKGLLCTLCLNLPFPYGYFMYPDIRCPHMDTKEFPHCLPEIINQFRLNLGERTCVMLKGLSGRGYWLYAAALPSPPGCSAQHHSTIRHRVLTQGNKGWRQKIDIKGEMSVRRSSTGERKKMRFWLI